MVGDRKEETRSEGTRKERVEDSMIHVLLASPLAVTLLSLVVLIWKSILNHTHTHTNTHICTCHLPPFLLLPFLSSLPRGKTGGRRYSVPATITALIW